LRNPLDEPGVLNRKKSLGDYDVEPDGEYQRADCDQER